MLNLEIFPASQLGDNATMLEQAQTGSNIVAHVDAGFLSEYGVPELAVAISPFLFADVEELETFVASDLFNGWLDQLQDENIRTLAMNWYFGSRNLYGNAAWPEPSDLEGALIRVPPNPSWVAMYDTLPSTPVTMAAGEIYSGLQTGVIDGSDAPINALYTFSIYEVADFVTMTRHFLQTTGWAMNNDLFESLCPEFQELLTSELQAAGRTVSDVIEQQEVTFQERLEAEGMTFVEANHDAYVEAVAGFYDQFPEWPDDLYEQVRATIDAG
jgi:TRAP-type C4-dicarboxylate transport system substrate-binding protein